MNKETLEKYKDKLLAQNVRGLVLALNENLVAKIRSDNSIGDLLEEGERLKFCNSINDLFVSYEDFWKDDIGNHLLVMERLYPIQYRSMTIGKRVSFFDEFEFKLRELHKNGFAFRDFNATKIVPPRDGEIQHNFILTQNGFRLIDVGVSILKEKLPPFITDFEKEVKKDIEDLKYVRNIACSL